MKKLRNFLLKIYSWRTNPLILVSFVFILIILTLGIWQIAFRSAPHSAPSSNQLNIDERLFEIPARQVLIPGSEAILGDLQIEMFDVREGEFKEVGGPTQKFLAVKIKVFNPSNSKTEDIMIGLEDDKGNRYLSDVALATEYFQDPELKSFGTNMSIFPRIIQEGYIFFKNVNKSSQKFNLIFALRSKPERIIFEFQK